jgi:phenylacetate-coenzyme A ligase PaaK-like adenylate-forming protein
MTGAFADPSIADQLSAHRISALASTLSYIQSSSPYYLGLLSGREITVSSATDILRSLPLMSAERWQAERDRIRTAPIGSALLGYTGGSTGKHKPFLSTQAERNAIKGLFGANVKTAMRTLNLVNMTHGVPSLDDYGANAVSVPFVAYHGHFDTAAKILERQMEPYRAMPPFEALSGSLHMIKQFTIHLLKRRGRVDDLGVGQITVFSQMLSPRWRARLEDWWQAEITEVYGSSELRMCNSVKCKYCDHYHLPPTCIGEVVDLDDGSSIEASSRCGSLAVTAFYPFVQLEPRIRYCPGDLVQLSEKICQFCGERGFRLLGRQQHSLPVGKQRWITSARCFDAIADLPNVATFDEAAVLTGDLAYHECGSPRFCLKEENNVITLYVEIRYDPQVWQYEVQAIRPKLRPIR